MQPKGITRIGLLIACVLVIGPVLQPVIIFMPFIGN